MLSSPIVLAKISLPVRLSMNRVAIECAQQIAELLSFTSSDTYKLKLAIDEAFCNAVEHFSGTTKQNDMIHLEFSLEEHQLIVSIRERGIPFNRNKSERFVPGDIDTINNPGLGAHLMKKSMDSVEFLVHGRKGKEVRMTKNLTVQNIPVELIQAEQNKTRIKRITVENPEIRFATEEDLPNICRLAWKCYGYTQEDFLYNLDAFKDKTQKGEVKSVIALDPESQSIMGHIGFKYHDKSVRVPEIGLAFVDPQFRSAGLPLKMARILYDLAEKENQRGIFDCSVTTHTISQKEMQQMGSRPCGILLGIAATGMQAKELKTTRQEKGSVVNHYYAFDRSHHTVHLPPHHKKMVNDIYNWINIPVTIETKQKKSLKEAGDISILPLSDELNVSLIVVNSIGENTAKEISQGLRKCRLEKRDAVYAFLPLGNSASIHLVEKLEKIRFSFAGIMPHIHNGDDRIILQYIDIPIETEKIKVYGEMTNRLYDYIRKEQQRVLML